MFSFVVEVVQFSCHMILISYDIALLIRLSFIRSLIISLLYVAMKRNHSRRIESLIKIFDKNKHLNVLWKQEIGEYSIRYFSRKIEKSNLCIKK